MANNNQQGDKDRDQDQTRRQDSGQQQGQQNQAGQGGQRQAGQGGQQGEGSQWPQYGQPGQQPPAGPESGAQPATGQQQPGYSGQQFQEATFERVRRLRAALPDGVRIQVDGGVGPENVKELYDAGASLLVAATAIFGREDLPRAYRRLVQALV